MKQYILSFCLPFFFACLTPINPPLPPPEDPCAPGALLPSDQTRNLVVDGLERRYRVHVPSGYNGSPTPIVLNFHGFGSDGFQQQFFAQMDPVADAEGFLVLYPDGIENSWNAGECCGSANQQNIDDVAFVKAILDDIESSFCVDQNQIFASGMSNGGFFSHRLACELSDRIAAIGPVAGGLVLLECNPERPVPVMHFHGTDDAVVPFDGEPKTDLPSIPDVIEAWSLRNECEGEAVETFLNGDSRCDTFLDCADGVEVTLCTVDGGGHTWPGGTPIPALGFTTQDLDASQAMWDFFEAHPLPE